MNHVYFSPKNCPKVHPVMYKEKEIKHSLKTS